MLCDTPAVARPSCSATGRPGSVVVVNEQRVDRDGNRRHGGAGADRRVPTDVAVTVAVLVASLAALAGTSTLTHTGVVAPDATVGVVVSGVVHVSSKKLTGNVPPEDDSE